MSIICLWVKHTRSALEGAGCPVYVWLCLGGTEARCLRPADWVALLRLWWWRWQVELAKQLGTGLSLSQTSLASYDALMLDRETWSPASSNSVWEHFVGSIWLRWAGCDRSKGRCQQAHLLPDPQIRGVVGGYDSRHSQFEWLNGGERGTIQESWMSGSSRVINRILPWVSPDEIMKSWNKLFLPICSLPLHLITLASRR